MIDRHFGQHASDMVRLKALYFHGDIWIEISTMLFVHPDQVCWKSLMDTRSRFEVALALMDPAPMVELAAIFFIAAHKVNGFIRRWMEVSIEV